ncbi:hypothetical protein FHR84_004313 [Actinopolyspora biskrensis]|uniref:Uncharacterized protein n=1 Tax=Actinopolyspora biskrensis TaxID=1470178 RepID=A0A852Z2C2_9ACTN|nr:hypothetical protein [Actinopolyspora biskrensis]
MVGVGVTPCGPALRVRLNEWDVLLSGKPLEWKISVNSFVRARALEPWEFGPRGLEVDQRRISRGAASVSVERCSEGCERVAAFWVEPGSGGRSSSRRPRTLPEGTGSGRRPRVIDTCAEADGAEAAHRPHRSVPGSPVGVEHAAGGGAAGARRRRAPRLGAARRGFRRLRPGGRGNALTEWKRWTPLVGPRVPCDPLNRDAGRGPLPAAEELPECAAVRSGGLRDSVIEDDASASVSL